MLYVRHTLGMIACRRNNSDDRHAGTVLHVDNYFFLPLPMQGILYSLMFNLGFCTFAIESLGEDQLNVLFNVYKVYVYSY